MLYPGTNEGMAADGLLLGGPDGRRDPAPAALLRAPAALRPILRPVQGGPPHRRPAELGAVQKLESQMGKSQERCKCAGLVDLQKSSKMSLTKICFDTANNEPSKV